VNKGRHEKGPETALTISGGSTKYIEELRNKRNYSIVPKISKKDPQEKR
jgi:hypothetical protein